VSPEKSSVRGSAIPCLRYRDAQSAIEWLCEVQGFEQQLFVPGEAGDVVHAQLTLGNVMVMLSSGGGHQGRLAEILRPPIDRDAIRAQSIYIVVRNIDKHYAHAVAGGAEIVMGNQDHEYGGRGYTCRDPEGNFWSFGSYDPWVEIDAS
jgi:uncharacterized glyoxalase superfamily protein PhnB